MALTKFSSLPSRLPPDFNNQFQDLALPSPNPQGKIEMIELNDENPSQKIDLWLIRYDYILIDCPPSLGLLTLNGMLAAKDV